jgi:hypothetical protein
MDGKSCTSNVSLKKHLRFILFEGNAKFGLVKTLPNPFLKLNMQLFDSILVFKSYKHWATKVFIDFHVNIAYNYPNVPIMMGKTFFFKLLSNHEQETFIKRVGRPFK